MSNHSKQTLKKISDAQNRTAELLEKAKSGYSFQKELTKELDNKTDDFDEITFLKIVLWKTNRFPQLAKNTAQIINELRLNFSIEKAKVALLHLLGLKGFDLPMASTVLRFACPRELQIIDKRVYRLIMNDDELKIPYSKEKKISMYFEYIEKLKDISTQCNIPFKDADRIFYQLDKNLNSEISIQY